MWQYTLLATDMATAPAVQGLSKTSLPHKTPQSSAAQPNTLMSGKGIHLSQKALANTAINLESAVQHVRGSEDSLNSREPL